MLAPWKERYDKPRWCIKKQRHHFCQQGHIQSYDFSSSHVRMWELDHKEGWVLKNWCFWIVLLEKILERHLDCKEIQPVHPRGNQPWVFTGRTDAEAEAPILWPPDAKSWLIGKDPDDGKDWRQKGVAEDEMARKHQQLNGPEPEETGDSEDQGSQSMGSQSVAHFDSNPAKTHGLPTEITDLVSGLWNLMKLRFLISHHRKNSLRDKVIGKKEVDLFGEKHTPQTECGLPQRVSAASKCDVISFYGLGNFIG